jgi:enterochelin esterase-like enzyme
MKVPMPNRNPSLESPRISALQKSLTEGDAATLDIFWQQVAAEGTPLIEPIPGDDQHALVTFLFRGDEKTEHVVLHSEILRGMWWDRWSDALLYRLPNTDVFYRSYRLRTDMRFVYWLSPNRPLIHIRDEAAGGDFLKLDPLNPRVFVEDFNRSYVEMPAAPPQPWWQVRPQVPAGRIEKHLWHSDILHNERQVWVHTPPGYSADHGPYPFLLLFDGNIFTTWIPGPTILDNLLADGRIPPMITVMIDSPDREEELNCGERFADCLAKELVPWVRQTYPISADPQQKVVGGISAGGQAAAFAALRHPEIFGNVLSSSGAFHWSKAARSAEAWSYEIPPEDCWLPQQFAACEKLPIRFHLDVGLLEDQRDFPYTTLLRGNRRMRDVLIAKGYALHYQETCAGHQYINFRGTFPEGLIALIGCDKRIS